jgi:hypothetical protein
MPSDGWFLLHVRENGDTRDLAILRDNKPNFDLSNSDKLKKINRAKHRFFDKASYGVDA